MFGNRDIPVYLFTGFLESGKTTCIKEILQEGNFEDGLKTLLLLTEEGEIGLSDVLLMDNRVQPVVVEEEEDLTEDYCNKPVSYTHLKKLKLPAKLREIGKAAFEEQKMSEVTIPSKVEKIETRAFCGCEYLKKIVIKSKKLKKVGSRAFADMGKDAVIYIPKERETEYRKMIEDSTAHAQIVVQ